MGRGWVFTHSGHDGRLLCTEVTEEGQLPEKKRCRQETESTHASRKMQKKLQQELEKEKPQPLMNAAMVQGSERLQQIMHSSRKLQKKLPQELEKEKPQPLINAAMFQSSGRFHQIWDRIRKKEQAASTVNAAATS